MGILMWTRVRSCIRAIFLKLANGLVMGGLDRRIVQLSRTGGPALAYRRVRRDFEEIIG